MAGITLAQLATLERVRYRKGVIMNIIRDAPLMATFPFENVDSLNVVATKWQKLPSGGTWRKLNEGFTSGEEGALGENWESLFGFGADITYDRVLDKIKNTVENPRVLQTKMKLKVLAYDWKYMFINGDHASNPDGIEGLKKRVSNMPSRQTVYFTANSTDAPLDPTGSNANARRFYDQLELAWGRCNGGNVNAVYTNELGIWGFGRVARYMQSLGSYLDTTKDVLGREFITWKGVTLFDMGYKADQTTEIIPNTETAGDGGADSTSMYLASYDKEQGIYGIQLEPIKVYDPLGGGEMESKPSKMLRVDWWNGLASFGSFGIVRMRNLAAPTSWT